MSLHIVDVAECWRLLGLQAVGRIGLSRPDGPVILPVNHAVIDGVIVFRTRVHAAPMPVEGELVAFEVDGIDAAYHAGWSVLVTGVASILGVPSTDLPEVDSWMSAGPMVLVTIEPISITGRILLQDPGDWAQDLRGYL